LTPPRFANCLIWALCAKWRCGGYVMVRESVSRWHIEFGPLRLSGKIPHFLVLLERHGRRGNRIRHVVSFVPLVRPDRPTPIYIALFDGAMQWGDAHAPQPQEEARGFRRRRLLLLRAFLLVGSVALGLLLWLVWCVWRFVVLLGELIAAL
jgi:hypothetical protein